MGPFNLISKIELITKDGKKTLGLIHDIIENKIYVSIPSDDKQFKILRVGDHINGIVYEDSKITGFNAIVTSRILGDTPIYELSFLDNLSKIQRRKAVRVPYTIPILYSDNKYLLNINEENEKAQETIFNIKKYLNRGMISDLSAGGLRFSCKQRFNMGHKLLLVFRLNDELYIIKGDIVYKNIIISPKETKYIYGLKFINISEEKSEKIFNHIFIMMRKNKLK